MSGPTIGMGRITIPYTVSSLTHECRMYVDNPTLVGAAWLIGVRPDVGGTSDWADAAQNLSETISYILPTGTTVGTAVLEEYFATGWVPRATVAVTMPNVSGSVALAGQTTLTTRADNFTRPKIVVMEMNNPAPLKITSPTGGGANYDGFIGEFLITGTLPARPYLVMTNMHGFFLSTSPFVSTTLTYNRKLRRARGLA